MAAKRELCLRLLALPLCLVAAATAVAAQGDRAEQLIAHGRERLSEQRYQKAFKLFAEADRVANGKSFPALDGLATSLLRLGRYEELAEVGERIAASSDQPDQRAHGHNYVGLARFYEARRAETGRFLPAGRPRLPPRPSTDTAALRREAAGAFRRALEVGGAALNEVRVSLAETLIDLGDHEEAAALLEQYAVLGGRSALAEQLSCWAGYAARTAEQTPDDASQAETSAPRRLTEPELRCPSDGSASAGYSLLVAGVVDEEGRSACVRVLASPPGCEQAAFDEVATWRWEPAHRSGEPVPVFFRQEVGIVR